MINFLCYLCSVYIFSFLPDTSFKEDILVNFKEKIINTTIDTSGESKENLLSKVSLEKKSFIIIDDFEISASFSRKRGKWTMDWFLIPKKEIELPDGYNIISIQVIGFLSKKDGSLAISGDLVSYSFSPPLTKRWSEGYSLKAQYKSFGKRSGFKPSFFKIKILYVDAKNKPGQITSDNIYFE